MENEKLDQMLEEREMYDTMYIEMDCKEVVEQKYDKKEFKRGIADASYYAGFMTAMFNAECSEEVSLAILQMVSNKIALDKQFEVEERLATLQASAVEMKEL